MNRRDQAAWEIHEFFTRRNVPYVVIGGMAVQHWGEPRFTQDVDVTAAAPPDDPESLVRAILDRFPARLGDAVAFARRNRVILIRAANGCPVDISLSLPGYEDELMQRAVAYEIEAGKTLRLCSAEDLIIHKAIAGRPQDVRDVESVVYRQRERLDAAYIRRWLREFSDLLARPEILDRFETPWRKVG